MSSEAEFSWNKWVLGYALGSILMMLEDIESGRTKVTRSEIEVIRNYQAKCIEGKKMALGIETPEEYWKRKEKEIK